MAELLKRIIRSNRNLVFLSDLGVSLRGVGTVQDLLLLTDRIGKPLTLEKIAASRDLDIAIANGDVDLIDQDGDLLVGNDAFEGTNLLTLNEIDGGAGGSDSFIALTDTPGSYVGSGLEFVRVNAGETALEFISLTNALNLPDLGDVVDSVSPSLGSILKGDGSDWDEFSIGSANQLLGVNIGGTDLEYKTLTAGSNITITPAAGAITIASTTAAAHDLLSATHSDAVTASPVLGDLVYGDASPEWNRLAGSTDSAQRILTQTGTGAVSAVPSWEKSITLEDLTLTETTNAPLTLPNSGSTPTSPSAGQIAVVNDRMYLYDSTRSKWLSMETMPLQWGNKGKVSNITLDFGGGSAHEDSGARTLFDGTIVGITATNADSTSTKGFDVLINNVSTISFSLSSGSYTDSTTNQNFSAGGILNVRSDTGSDKADNPTVILWIKWRI